MIDQISLLLLLFWLSAAAASCKLILVLSPLPCWLWCSYSEPVWLPRLFEGTFSTLKIGCTAFEVTLRPPLSWVAAWSVIVLMTTTFFWLLGPLLPLPPADRSLAESLMLCCSWLPKQFDCAASYDWTSMMAGEMTCLESEDGWIGDKHWSGELLCVPAWPYFWRLICCCSSLYFSE